MSTADKTTVFDAIRSGILQGEYAPRQRLVELELCEQFGVARFGVRAALQELASHGLVEFQPNRGARVRDVSFAEAVEITEIRQLVEGLAAARAADRITKPEANSLRELVRDMRTAVANTELLRYSELNAQFHAAIRTIAAHQTAARLLSQLRDQTVRHQFTLSLVPGRPSVSLRQHETIAEAITAQKPEQAQAAMHEHLESVIEALKGLATGAAARR